MLNPYGLLFAGLLVLNEVIRLLFCRAYFVQVAYTESGRKKEIEETLTGLLVALHRIQLTAEFPHAVPDSQLENLQCAAINLCATVMDYVSVTIKILRKILLEFTLCFTSSDDRECHVNASPWKHGFR